MSSAPGCPSLCLAPWIGVQKPWSQFTARKKARTMGRIGPHSGQRRVLGSQDGAFPTSVDTTPHGKSSAISPAGRGRQFFR